MSDSGFATFGIKQISVSLASVAMMPVAKMFPMNWITDLPTVGQYFWLKLDGNSSSPGALSEPVIP